MPRERSSWLARSIGLVLSRRLLRRSLALHGARGEAMLATVILRPVVAAEAGAAHASAGCVPSWD